MEVRIGAGALPLGLEQALIGMGALGVRLVLLPPEWQDVWADSAVQPSKNALNLLPSGARAVQIFEIEMLPAPQPEPQRPESQQPESQQPESLQEEQP